MDAGAFQQAVAVGAKASGGASATDEDIARACMPPPLSSMRMSSVPGTDDDGAAPPELPTRARRSSVLEYSSSRGRQSSVLAADSLAAAAAARAAVGRSTGSSSAQRYNRGRAPSTPSAHGSGFAAKLKRKPPADMFAIRHPFLESRPSFAGRRFHRARLLQCNMMRRSVRREGEPHFFTSSSAGRQAMDVEADTTEQGDDLEMSEDEGEEFMLWVQLVSSTGALPSQSMHYRVPLNLPPLENVDAQHRNLTRLAKAIRKSFSIADSSVLVVACRDQASGSFEPLTTMQQLYDMATLRVQVQ